MLVFCRFHFFYFGSFFNIQVSSKVLSSSGIAPFSCLILGTASADATQANFVFSSIFGSQLDFLNLPLASQCLSQILHFNSRIYPLQLKMTNQDARCHLDASRDGKLMVYWWEPRLVTRCSFPYLHQLFLHLRMTVSILITWLSQNKTRKSRSKMRSRESAHGLGTCWCS